ncbi:MAG: hypothetical protein EOM21_21130, partial [Gammaproteobacteria bacterium]|nr:hypothetical protein [Gammaproteobacteria bacterium]
MIEPRTLLIVLRQQLKALEDDIRDHLGEQPERDAELRADWQAARDSGRVAAAYPQWRDEEITQAAVHWVLACVFLRVIEDQSLVDRPWLSGATQALRELAQDRHDQYFRQHPLHSDRDYLIHCFEDAARLPALGGLFDRAHNPLWRIRPSGDGAMALLGLWRAVDPDRGTLRLDFSAGPASARTSAPGLEQGSADGVFAARGRLAEAAPTNRRLGRRQEAQHPPARAPNRSGQGAT